MLHFDGIFHFLSFFSQKDERKKCPTDRWTSEIRQSTIYYAGLLGRWNKRIVYQVSDVPSIIFFHDFLQNSLEKWFQCIFFLFFFFTNLQK